MKNLSKETIFILLRTLLTAVGAFLVGKNIFGFQVDESTLQIVIGALMALGSIIWGIVDQSAGIEQIQSTIRQVFVAFGGILISAGKLSSEMLETYLGLALAIGAFVYTILSKKKTNDIAKGKLEVLPPQNVYNIPDTFQKEKTAIIVPTTKANSWG